MNGWKVEWLRELPQDEYEVLVEWVNEQIKSDKQPDETDD